MASSLPSGEAIRQVCEFCGISEGDAIVILRKSNNDPSRAVDAFYQDPAGAIRDEPAGNEWQYQDNIPYADDTSMVPLPATPPPSRNDNARNMIDLTAEHAAATASNSKTLKEQEDLDDPELQRAMALSMGQAVPDQEDGVTGTGQQFGPATKSYYDPSQWAMTAVASSREIVDHPPPTKRRRLYEEPAFLRGSRDTGYLGALLTIYHSIPLAKEALLSPSLRIMSYGYDSTWWSGISDENSKSLSMETADNNDTAKVNFLAEVQCLMAFLDGTHRAYGSVDALADLQAMRSFQSETHFSKFLEVWKDAAMRLDPQEPLTQIFSSTAMKDPGFDNLPPIEKNLVCLEPPVKPIEGQNLVDLLDNTVWNDTPDNLDDVWIQRCAEVFTMRLHDPGNAKDGLRLNTTSVWYPDRYMYECRAITLEMREAMRLIRKEIKICTAFQERCEMIPGSDRRELNVREVLEAASRASALALLEKQKPLGTSGERRISENGELGQAEVQAVESEIETTIRRIDEKLRLLEQKKDELQAQMRQIALQLTEKSDNPNQPPFMKYVLQGVSTKPEITYIRRRNHDLLHLEDGDGNTNNEWQWWRISWFYNTIAEHPQYPSIGPVTQAQAMAATGQSDNIQQNNLKPFTIKKVTEADVIEAAKVENSSVVLVYVSENAMRTGGNSLPQALKQWVEQDNQSFEQELREELTEDRNEELEGEDEDTIDNLPPAVEGRYQNGVTREMTPMSISSPPRDEDGQPSPKRPKSSDENFRSMEEEPPSYEESVGKPEMQERGGNKIGLYAERMLEKYGDSKRSEITSEERDGMHIEHSTDLPR